MITNAREAFELLIRKRLIDNDEHLLNDGPEEQLAEALRRFDRFTKTTPLEVVYGEPCGMAGFGEPIPIWFRSAEDSYFLLSDAAESIGWSLPRACEWAEREYGWAVQEQRRTDEDRGDGRLGYECMRDYFDTGLQFIFDDPEAKPDAGGRRWSDAGDWLISVDRKPLMLSCSNWGREYMNNVGDAMSYAFLHAFGDKLGPDGRAFFSSDLTEEEAFRKAVRGPALDPEDGAS